jgi:hypothetical protein
MRRRMPDVCGPVMAFCTALLSSRSTIERRFARFRACAQPHSQQTKSLDHRSPRRDADQKRARPDALLFTGSLRSESA